MVNSIAVVIDSNTKRQQHQEVEGAQGAGVIPRSERRTEKDVETEGNSGPMVTRTRRAVSGRVAQEDFRNNIQDLWPEECSPRNG